MSLVKIRVLNGTVNGQPAGSLLDVEERSANHFAKHGVLEIIEEVKAPVKKESAPKKPAAKKSSTKKKAEK